MRIATYNVNGINGRLTNLLDWLQEVGSSRVGAVVRPPIATTDVILEYARWIEKIAPGFIALIILALRGETIEPVVRSGFWPSSRQATIHTGAS